MHGTTNLNSQWSCGFLKCHWRTLKHDRYWCWIVYSGRVHLSDFFAVIYPGPSKDKSIYFSVPKKDKELQVTNKNWWDAKVKHQECTTVFVCLIKPWLFLRFEDFDIVREID